MPVRRVTALLGALLALALLVGCGRVREDTPDAGTPGPPAAAAVPSTQPLVSALPETALEPPQAPEVLEPPEPTEATPGATAEATPVPPVRTPTPIPVRAFEATEAVVVFPTVGRASPSSLARPVRDLPAGSRVSLVGQERGENWIIGDQDWVPTSHEWERTWYRLDDGSYVYRAFVFLPDRAPLPAPGGAERYVIVDLASQTAWAMVGQTAVREMPVTTGKPGFETPTGTWEVLSAGRILDERMTSQRAGFDDPSDRYDVQHVLFTQYFAEGGFALHMNYWQPTGVFGETETSHGCVGLLLEDAQYLWLFGRPGMRVIVRNNGGPVAPPPASPPPSAAPTPPAVPATEVKMYAVQDGKPGAPAVVAARTLPGTACALTYVAPSGVRRELPGMEPRSADAAGWLEWKWTIEPDGPPGKGTVTVTCLGGSASADFFIR